MDIYASLLMCRKLVSTRAGSMLPTKVRESFLENVYIWYKYEPYCLQCVHVKLSTSTSLVLVFLFLFSFSIIHGSGRARKMGKAWEHLSCE